MRGNYGCVSELERQDTDRYSGVWANLPLYGEFSPAVETLPVFRALAPAPALVLDAGCGSGKGAVALVDAGYEVLMTDLTNEGLCAEARRLSFRRSCLWKPLRPQVKVGQVDYVFCVDVLEHVPQQFVMLAVDQMLALARGGVFLQVAFTPDSFGVWLGESLHVTLQSYTWWRDSLAEVGRVVEARDLINRGLYFVKR